MKKSSVQVVSATWTDFEKGLYDLPIHTLTIACLNYFVSYNNVKVAHLSYLLKTTYG
jgi:hypothetical protein